MTAPVLVRGSLRTWDCMLLLVAGLLLVIGACVAAAARQPVLAGILLVAAFGSPLAGLLIRRHRMRRCRWVQDQGDGFLVTDRDGERRYADDDALGMALNFRQNYVNGVHKSVTRRFIVWLANDGPAPEPLEMVNTMPPGVPGPLSGHIDRIGDLLYRRAREDLAAGQPVPGELWTLQKDELTVRGRGESRTCAVADLVAVEAVDNAICVWKAGQDEAFARVPKDSANAYVLWRLLAEEVAKRPAAAPPEGGSMGRIIFERRPKKSTAVALAVVAAIGLVVCPFLVLSGDSEAFFGGIACLAVAAACVVGALHLARAAFRCHEYGIYNAGLGGAQTMRYADMAAFSYNSVRMYNHGAYTGTRFMLSFEPTPECGGPRIRYAVTLRQADAELEGLRDRISRIIAGRLHRQLTASGAAPWTPALDFRRDGLEYRPRGFLVRKGPVFIPYADIYSYQIQQGWFNLWVRGQRKPAVSELMTRRNFFPGYYLLASLTAVAPPDGAGVRLGNPGGV